MTYVTRRPRCVHCHSTNYQKSISYDSPVGFEDVGADVVVLTEATFAGVVTVTLAVFVAWAWA